MAVKQQQTPAHPHLPHPHVPHPHLHHEVPFYSRMLRLRHIHPRPWHRAVLGEGSIALAGLLVMMDVASSWVLVALPVAVAATVKFHDLLAGALAPSPATKK